MSLLDGTINQNISRYSIYEDSLVMVKESISTVLSDYGKDKIDSVIVNSGWGQRKLEEVFGKMSYPYIAMRASQFQRNYESYNYNLNHTRYLAVRGSGNKVTRLRLMPVRTQFSIAFVSQDQADLIKLSEAWLLRFRSFRFVMKSGNLEIGIRVVGDDMFTFPEQQAEESGNLFRTDVGGFFDSYIGESESVIGIDKMAVQTSVGPNPKGSTVETSKTFKEVKNP